MSRMPQTQLQWAERRTLGAHLHGQSEEEDVGLWGPSSSPHARVQRPLLGTCAFCVCHFVQRQGLCPAWVTPTLRVGRDREDPSVDGRGKGYAQEAETLQTEKGRPGTVWTGPDCP